MKICGLTRAEDVIAARDLGVWAVGFVFAPSPRQVEPDRVRRLIEAAGLRRTGASSRRTQGVTVSEHFGEGHDRDSAREEVPITVGVFTDQPADEIASVVLQVGLQAVQLHGLAGPSIDSVAAALGGSERSTLILRAIPVRADEVDPEVLRRAIAEVEGAADVALLDTKVSNGGTADGGGSFGGSGAVFPWDLVRRAVPAATRTPVLVAGGIAPDNAVAALGASGAWGVDVSSGVETSPGVKDAVLMQRLVTRVKEGMDT